MSVHESEESPLLGEPRLILGFGSEAREFRLKVTLFVDGTLGGGIPLLQDKNGAIGPGAGRDELSVGFRLDEDIGELWLAELAIR